MTLIFSLIVGCAKDTTPHTAPIKVGALTGYISVRSWKEMRDEKIIKQKHDYSCGAASLATILKYYYNQDVTEKDVIDAVNKDAWLSFGDIYNVLDKFGMKGYGLALSYEQLRNLKIPVIMYIEHKGTPHFAVLRGIDDRVVWVADPAHGNTRYPIDRFLDKWEVRDDEKLKGKVLVILPKDQSKLVVNKHFFFVPKIKRNSN